MEEQKIEDAVWVPGPAPERVKTNAWLMVRWPYADDDVGMIGRLGRLLWGPVAYVIGRDFKL